jgi:sugar O-acyltransferase (sialic acid O-acetyltransferase NeuD family)
MASGGDLVVMGASGLGRETVEAVRAMNECGSSWRLLGYLDDDPALCGKYLDGVPVLGGKEELKKLPNALVVVCTGRPDNYLSRPRIVKALDLPDERYATIVHPAAAVSTSSRIGPGSVLLAGAVLTAAVRTGSHVAVMSQVTLTHDDIVEDFATLASGVRLSGRVHIGEGAWVGAGALVREERAVGAYALVGMGSVVLCDVPACEVWAGVPARYLRSTGIRSEHPVLLPYRISRARTSNSPGSCGRAAGCRARCQLACCPAPRTSKGGATAPSSAPAHQSA